MRIIRAAECLIMPWKNGGGTTTEIAAHPQGASLNDFDWRISMAHVGTDGPFSTFAGIDRTLSVLRGDGIALAFDDGETIRLERTSGPHAFAADRPVTGRLVAGPIDDLNVMTRRGRWRHAVRRLTGPGPIEIEAASELLVLVAGSDGWVLSGRDGRESLGTSDSAMFGRGEAVTLAQDGNCEVFAIELSADAAP